MLEIKQGILALLGYPIASLLFLFTFLEVNLLTDCLGREKSDLGPGSFCPLLFVGPLPSPL